jgi:mitogen-activated protein kinase kinase
MLDHPWMVEMRTKRVNMGKYLSQVWGWDNTETQEATGAGQA